MQQSDAESSQDSFAFVCAEPLHYPADYKYTGSLTTASNDIKVWAALRTAWKRPLAAGPPPLPLFPALPASLQNKGSNRGGPKLPCADIGMAEMCLGVCVCVCEGGSFAPSRCQPPVLGSAWAVGVWMCCLLAYTLGLRRAGVTRVSRRACILVVATYALLHSQIRVN